MRIIAAILLSSLLVVGSQQNVRSQVSKDGTIPLDKQGIELLNANGRWAKFEQGQKRRVHVWHEDEVWHFRCTCSKGEKSRFDGTVTVDRGQLQIVSSIGNVPAFGKSGKVTNAKYADYVQAIPNGVAFCLRSAGKLEGLDFTVPKEAKKVRFEFQVDGDPLSAYIFVGPNGDHPAKASFILDAHPKPASP